MVNSTITGNKNTHLLKSIDTESVIEMYQKRLSIDVRDLLEKHNKINLYRCDDTGYCFYHPFDIAGDGRFYEQLQKFDWYYIPWKWEHEQTLKLLSPNLKVLEVGCANGSFIEKIQKDFKVQTVGLELNEDVVMNGIGRGLDIRNEMIDEHAKKNKEKYDLICSYQVLEHISDVRTFIEAQIEALRPGGKLVICVPNNDSFTKYDWENDILNMPPHHMGLWDRNSLKSLTKLFPLRVVRILNEPLQEYHRDWYMKVLKDRIRNIIWPIPSIYNRLRIHEIIEKFITRYPEKIAGHSILAIFEKT